LITISINYSGIGLTALPANSGGALHRASHRIRRGRESAGEVRRPAGRRDQVLQHRGYPAYGGYDPLAPQGRMVDGHARRRAGAFQAGTEEDLTPRGGLWNSNRPARG